ncbi:unnamed protein product [Arabis nemorensis]|uniref:Uncharacterized protein n=1 Tax=Arabis nemorensis TaxID=586526 RepID=A0A565BAX5_9BRAS|nr:unnamed protein product [Arabis nemorensis]
MMNSGNNNNSGPTNAGDNALYEAELAAFYQDLEPLAGTGTLPILAPNVVEDEEQEAFHPLGVSNPLLDVSSTEYLCSLVNDSLWFSNTNLLTQLPLRMTFLVVRNHQFSSWSNLVSYLNQKMATLGDL